jgi:hypothetical protein
MRYSSFRASGVAERGARALPKGCAMRSPTGEKVTFPAVVARAPESPPSLLRGSLLSLRERRLVGAQGIEPWTSPV